MNAGLLCLFVLSFFFFFRNNKTENSLHQQNRPFYLCFLVPAVIIQPWLLMIFGSYLLFVIVCRIKENGIRSYYQEQHGMKKGKNFVWFLYL
jgi:hypothetical protein